MQRGRGNISYKNPVYNGRSLSSTPLDLELLLRVVRVVSKYYYFYNMYAFAYEFVCQEALRDKAGDCETRTFERLANSPLKLLGCS